MSKSKEQTEEQKLSALLKEKIAECENLSERIKSIKKALEKEIADHTQTKVRHNAIYAVKVEEIGVLTEKLKNQNQSEEGVGITDSAWSPD